MATLEGTGTMKLATRILDDARAEADAAYAEAKQNVEAIRAESDRKLAERAAEFAAKREAAVQGVLDGCRTRVSLDGRKAALVKKRAVIDEVFDKAYQAMLSLDEKTRGDILMSMLTSEAEDGDVVVPAKADRALVSARVAGFRDAAVRLSDEDAPIDGGFLLKNEGYDKDCSFASLLDNVRGAEETNVAKMLFGGQR